jgi:hypothetical protein
LREGRSAIGRFALTDGVSLFLRRIENALGDLDVLKRQVMLLRAQPFGSGAELVAPQFADDHLEPAPCLFRLRKRYLMIGERSLRLRQKRLQPGILCGQGGDGHAPLQSQFDCTHHQEEPSLSHSAAYQPAS